MPSYSGIFTLQAQMQAIAAGTWTGIPLAIGDAYEGGYYAGQISTAGNGVADYNLVVGPLSTAQTTNTQWKNANTATTGADSVIDGPQNTSDMVADGNSTVYPAAHFCNNLTIGGFSDWYFPAKNEFEVCYYNLKPTTANNNTSGGTNTNAVPSRGSNYTTGDPSQTSATAFVTGTGGERFTDINYWSSTDYSATTALTHSFGYGLQINRNKASFYSIRAVRRVAV